MIIYRVDINNVQPFYFTAKAEALKTAREWVREVGNNDIVRVRSLISDQTMSQRDLACEMLNGGMNWVGGENLIDQFTGKER